MLFSSFFLDQSLVHCDKKIDSICSMQGKELLDINIYSKTVIVMTFSTRLFSAGSSVMAAYVEIVFDNSDGKHPYLVFT